MSTSAAPIEVFKSDEGLEIIGPIKLADQNWRPDLTSAYRRVGMDYFGMGGPLGRITVRSLTRKLHRADRELTIAADLSEAQVVPHTWGIIDEDEPWLVAKVDRIIPEDPQNELLTVTKGVLNYNLSRRWRRDLG